MGSKQTDVEKALSKLLRGDGLKIGAKSSFFYCGTVGDFLNRHDAYSLECERRAAYLAKKAQEKLRRMLTMNTGPSGYAAEVATNKSDGIKPPMTVEAYHSWVTNYFKAVELQKSVVERAESIKRNVVPLINRKVIRFEKSTSEEGCWILILSGDEIGGYWSLADAGAKGSHISFAAEEKDYAE